MPNIIIGAQIKIENTLYDVKGVWWKNRKISRYEFWSEKTGTFYRNYDYIQGLLKKGTIEVIAKNL